MRLVALIPYYYQNYFFNETTNFEHGTEHVLQKNLQIQDFA